MIYHQGQFEKIIIREPFIKITPAKFPEGSMPGGAVSPTSRSAVPSDLYFVGLWPFSVGDHAKRWNFGFQNPAGGLSRGKVNHAVRKLVYFVVLNLALNAISLSVLCEFWGLLGQDIRRLFENPSLGVIFINEPRRNGQNNVLSFLLITAWYNMALKTRQ